MSEKWEEVYTKEQILKIQEIEMINLREIIRVCDILGISFLLYGGSLIGAVKYAGFVPWDDDLDIAMMRTDYMRFVEEAPKYLSAHFSLQTPYSDSKTPYFYSKLRLKGTKYIEYGNHRLNIEQGIYVDIYPLDFLPDDEQTYLNQHVRYQKIVQLFVLRQCPYRYVKSVTIKDYIKSGGRYLASSILRCVPLRFFVEKIDSIMTEFNDLESRRIGNYSFPKPCNYFDKIFPLHTVSFNGVNVYIPNGWEDHLYRRYGDYKELPPEEERIGHKPYLLDFGEYEKRLTC